MVGIVLFLLYLLLGVMIAGFVLPDKSPLVRAWAGGVIGITALMWSNIPFSFLLGFTRASHFAGLGLTVLLTALLFVWRNRGARIVRSADGVPGVQREGGVPGAQDVRQIGLAERLFGSWRTPLEQGEKTMLILLVPFMVFAIICLLNHTFYEVDGAYYTGQCTYGDMNFHLGIITSLKEQGTFPPDYSICPGEPLDYYFLSDSVSSSLYLFGLGLRASYMLPMLFGFLLVFVGFWILARTVLRSCARAHVAFTLFFLNGGFGLIYFLDNLRENPGNFTQIFTEYYHTPTNYVNSQGGTTNICWTNTVVDMMLPQRATLFGWMLLFLVLYVLYLAVFEGRENAAAGAAGAAGIAAGTATGAVAGTRRTYLLAGVLAGLTPMVQTYSYFTVGLVAIAWICYTAVRDRMRRTWLVNWLCFGLPALLLSLPQLFLWVFGAVDGESFVQIRFNAYNATDNWLWFWVKNVGVVFILLVPAFMNASKRLRAFYSAGLLIFVVTEFVQFQTFAYDNNKLYLMWYAFSCVLVAEFLGAAWRKMEGLRGRMAVALIVLVLATNAAILTMGREMISGFRPQSYELYGRDGVQAAEFIRENTEKDALFLSYNNHNNIIACLTGRNIFVGSGTFLASHDVGYREREAALGQIFTDSAMFEAYRAQYGFDYVYISSYERNNFGREGRLIDGYLAERYAEIYNQDGVVIYDVREARD